MTLTDYTLKNKGPPEWIEEDQIVSVQGRVGEDIIVEMKLALSENYDDLRFELIKDGLPISTDRYQLSMRGNIVQLALNQSRKTDAGYYSLIATRLGQENNKGALKKIHLNISETSYEVGDPPVFLRRLSDLAVKVGTRTRFLIEIRSSTSLKITWYKDDTPIYDGARFSLVHEGNFHCVDVAPVRIEDQGCWTCMAENHSGRSSCTSTLTVIVPKAYKKPEFVEELRALLTETGTVSLECKVIGVPTPILRWFKDNKEIKAGDVFALTANPDDPTSLGVYTCEAVNCMGTAYSSSKVHVVGRGSREGSLKPADALTPSGPLPIFKQILQDECCRIGDTILLSCRVQVPPWPKAIAWYNKEGRIEPNEKYHVIEDGIGGYSIEIKQVEAMDEGEWKCVATSEDNMKQFTSCYVAMSIPRNYRKPRFMENLKAVLTEEGLVSFECKVVGFPTPLLRWFKDGQELKPGDVYQLTGTNSLGSYCCIARNCMGEAKSTAELTIEDIQNQLNEEERFQLLSTNQPPKFIKGLRSCEAKINEDFRFTVQVSVAPEPTLSWYRDDALMDDESDKYHIAKENLGTCHFEVRKLEFVDQAEWKCVAANDFGHSVTSCFLKLIIPKHYKKPKFLESLRAILSEEGAVNLECKVIGVPQPVLKWYKDNVELKPGDIHRIISGQDGTCCLGIYTCEATNCMGTVSSSASLLGFENRKDAKEIQPLNGHELARNLSLSTIHEERTSQLYDTPQTDHSVTLDERGEVSFSFDGKEVSVSLYETPDLTEEEALQIVEMYADQLSEHVTEHNVIELPPMRFVKETSTTGNLLMEAVVIDVSPDYFVSAEDGDDLRTEADFEDVSIMDDVTHVLSSPERDSRSSLKRSARYNVDEDEKVPNRPPRKKSMNASLSKSERSQQIESESFHSVQKDDPPLSPLSSLKQDDSDTFADALSSAHLSITESLVQKNITSEHADNRKRSLSAGRSTGSSLDDGIGGDSSFDSMTGVPKKMQRKKKQRKDKSNSEKYSDSSDEQRKRSESEDNVNTKIKSQPVESVYETEMDNKNEAEIVKELLFTKEKLDFQDNLKSVNEINSHVSKETKKSTEDILSEPRIALHKALELFHEKLILNAHTAPLFSDIYEQIDNIYQILETSKGIGADIEILTNLEIPLHTLLKKINEIISVEYVEIIHDILQPSIVQLSHAIEKLESSSLQPTFVILKNFSKLMCNISSGSEKLSSTKSISDESQNISEEIVDSLLDIQSTFSEILQQMEQSKLSVNKSGKSQQISITSELMACLIELRECVSHTAHTAMALKENETLSSLMEFRKPLLDLQLILSANRGTFYELSTIKEINIAVAKLKSVIVTILNDSTNRDVIFQIKTIFKILEDTDKQILKLVEQSSEMKIVQKRMLKNLDIEQSLSKVHFALSSVLEKQHITSSHLITSIEVLRQTIGSSAVTIANLNNPVDNEITQEISTLNESLLNLQRNLLTEKHELEEEQILDNLMHPIGMLKAIIHNIIENSSSVQSILPMLELLEDIEKDIALVTKEISKRKYQEESITQSQKENTVEESNSKSILATLIRHSLDPIKNWLSVTSDDSTKDEMKSTLSSTIEELKKDITQIAIQTSYSEVPNDESLIKALIDLREPLMRLNTAMSVVDYGPEDISVLENLNCPMKYLLQTIMSVLHERAQEKSLRPIINIIKQIENQIPLSIKDALYQQELKQNAKALNIEMGQKEEETVSKISKETIPGTLTEVATIPFEIGSTTSFTEQATTENNFDRITDDVQTIKNEKQEREKDAGKLIIILLETLEKLQLEITSILEDFEESITQTTTIPQSKLANFLEDLRSIISTIYMTIIHSEETSSLEEKFNQTTLVLINLMQPLTNIRNLLSRSHEHDVSELIILNRFSPLLDIIEINVIRQIINFVNKDENVEKKLECLLCVLKEIKTEIPIVIQEISLRRKILEHLWDISKPLDSILERMSDLEKAAEETLETDVANILGKPINSLLKDIKIAIQEVDALDRREPLILELRNFIEPLLEFHSCLSMVQNSRKSLVPEASLLEERRSVILRAVDGLQKQVCHTVEIIANMEDAFLFNESLTLLNSAILQVQKQVDKTDYSRRSSSTQISLQHRLTGTLSRLAKAIIALQEHTDEDTYGIVSKCLEALQKQISFSQTQFNQINNELIDEEAIIEGFLYPANQLLSALNILKENIQKQHLVISHSIVYFQELADSITELSFSLSAYKTELVREGTSEGAPIVETFSAVIDVLGHIKDSVTVIKKAVDNEQKASMIITKVESVTDEIIEVSQEEIENIMMITEIPSSKAIVQEAQSEIGGTPITTQISILENLETVQQTSVKQMKNNNLTDSREYEENQKENERKEHLIAEISKFNCAINNLIQPLRELINLVKSTKQKSLVSKSEENKRKIQELTALIQVLNDLQATNASITTVISSSSVILLDSQFSCMKAILSDLEQAVGTVISLTHEGVRPELKENIMTSLQFIGKPLDSLENILASIYQTIDKDRYIDKDRELSEVAQTLISCINDTVKSLNEMQISKCLSIADDKENEMEISEVKEEIKNIEEITARPLEELIEAIMDSQEIKCDKTSESDLSFMNTIESKDIDNLKSVESQLNETLVKKMDDSAKRDKVDTPQVTSLPESDQAEKLFIKNTGMIKTITQSLEKVEEQNLATIDKQEIEPIQISENNIILEKQIKVETLRTIISPLQVLRKSFDQIGEIGVFESSDKKAIAFSALIEPLLNLEFVLPEVTEDIKQDTVTLQGLSVVSILDEVQRSVATIQEEMQLQLNAMAETSLNKTPKILLAQAIMKPLGDLRISIARIQSDPMINQFVQQGSELSNVEQITILQNLVKSVTQFGERFTSIVNQIEIEATLPLQTIKQTDQQLDLEVLHKIVNPIHVLRETLSQIENLNNYEAEVLEIPKQKITTAIVQLTAVMDSLEKLEQSLIISTQQIIDMREKITKELNEDQNLFTSMNLKPILEELKNSITIVQEQIIFDEDIPALKTLTEALENLKMPLITVEEVIDHSDKVTEIEKIATLLSFAKSVENTANQLMAIAKRDMAKQEVKEISLIKTMTIPIEELQSAILKLEDQVSQTLETKGSIKTVSFECMVQPLQELQQLFLTSSYQETALFLQELPLKPILDNLNKSVAVIQDQITLIQNVLIDGNTDDSIILKDFAKSLGNLRTSTVVLQQLNAIENAGQQIVEIENASALQAFAKSIEEFKKSCSVIVERPRIIEALTKNIELKQLNKIDAQLIENIVAPLRILQEQILTIEESKMQESEILDLTEVRKPITVLSSLVSPLQQLEKSLVATVQKQHVIEHDGHNLTIESSSVSLEKLALQPVLEEVQKSIATVQEHMILETGKQIPSEIESDTLLKSIAQPLVDLKASIASIQQVTAIAPDFLTELAQEQNVSTLETFAKILHNLTECMAMCNQQQVIMEPAADTISEDALSLNTWADVIDEAASKITHPMVIDQGVIESPTEIAMSMSEEEMSSLRTLAKPLTELRECLALIVEEQKTVPLCDTTCVLSEKENISLTKTMIQPLLELKQAAAIIIQEQMAIECTNEHSFVVDGKNEFTLRCLVEPLEELRHSIAIIQDQMLIETLTDQSKNDIILNALAEPLFDIQRAISILETRVMSPDVESMSEDVGNNWITECLATPLHEIERSIAEIRQCDVMEPKTTIVEEKSKTLMPDRSIIEKLIKPVESIKSTISRMENDSTEIEVLKTIEKPLANVRENLMLLTDKYNLSAVEKKDVHAFIESLFNLEERISFIKKEIIDKPMPKQSSTMKIDTTISVVNIPLTELKYSIAAIKDSPSLHLQNLEKPLELVQNVFETIVSIQQNKKLSELSTKIINSISDISNSIESIENTLERQQISVVEIHIEYAALGILAKSLRNVKQCIIQIQEKPNTVNLMTHALESLEKSISLVQEQSADKPLVESQHTNFDILSKSLILCLHELQESIQTTKTLWREETVLDGLIIFEKPISKLQTAIKIIYDQSLEETISKIDKFKRVSQKKFVKKEIYTSEIETNEKFIKNDNETNKIKEETGENKLIKDINSTIINDTKEKKNEKKLEKEEEEIEQEKVKDDKKSTELIHEEEEEVNKIKNKDEKQKREHVIEKIQKVNEKQENEEIEQIKKAAEQSKQAKDKIIEQSEKENKKVKKIDSFEKHKETGEMQEMKNQQEKMDTVESIKNIVEESQQFIDVKEVKEEQNEQWNKKDYVETEKTECEEKQKEENVEKKKIAECKRIEMDQSIESKEKVESKEIKDSKNIEQSHEQYKQEEKQEKEVNRTQQEHQREREVEMIQKEIDEFDNEVGITKIKRNEEHKNLKKDKKLEKEQENFEDEKCAVPLNQNKNVSKNEKSANQLKHEEEQKKGNKEEKQEQKKQETKEKLKKKENKKVKSEKTEEVKNEKEKSSLKEDTVQEEIKEHKQEKIMEEVEKVMKQEKEQKKKETIEKIKEKENKKTNGQKIEELRKEKEDSNENKKQIQKKIEVQQKEVEDAKKQERELNNKETIEKVKEERDKTKRNEEIIKLEKEIKDTNKKEEKMKEEKQKKKDEDKILMNKENKESTKAEEIKIIKEEQTEIKRNIQEKEEKITQERDKVAEKVKEKEMSKRKEEIDKTGEIIQQAQCEYVNGIKKRKYLQMDENKKKQNYKIIMLQSQQEESKSKLEEKLETLEREEEEEQHKLQHDQSWSYTKKWVDKNSERWIQKDEDDQERDNKKQHRMEMERLEKKRIMRRTKQEADYISILDEENRQKRNEERKIRRDETTRLLWEKEQRLRKRQEEEIFRNRQRRKEQIKENEWSRKRENESDRFLRNMLETTYKSTPMFFNIDYSREYSSRFDSSVSILSSISRSYSWRDSLTSLSGKKVDDYWNYKLRSPVDKYYFDTSLSYRRRRKRENRMIRARSTSLLKYEDYSTGDSDATIVPSTNIRSFRRTKAKTASRIDFDACESNLFRYIDFSQNKSFPWEKLKKPSFCTRLTNRIVGVGMRIRLTCTVLGNPEPRVYWTKDNQKLDASNKRCRMRYENGMAYLELDEALLEDAGIYTCVAENTQGTSITESILSVYSDYKPMHSSPIFVKSIKDTYRYSDRKLILECRVRSYPVPIISWLKDGVIIQGERYKQSYLDDDVYRLEIADPDLTDNGQYTCRAANELYTEEISHIVHVEDWQSVNRNDLRSDHETKSEVERKPRFSNLLKDYNVPAGGTIALQVEVKGVPAPEVKWLRGDRKEPITIPQARTFAERGLYTLIVPEATESERGIYVCRAINAYGQVDTSATVDVISSSTVDGGKPAVFVSRPFKKSIDVIVGEDISISFRVSGIPKPRIIWMKGLTDITDGPRSYKESIDDYVRLTLKRVIPSDEGTYCILVKNRYGCDRSFFSIKIKQRARSLTPLSDWNSVTERDAEEYNNDMSYVRNVPGPISSEPVAIDGGKSWLSLSWGKAERRGPAPVIAYKVEAWLLGGDGGARWVELGITPINAFDAFNLRPGGEYKFRVTPRNRYGWGEPVTMTNSVIVSESTDLPEFIKILPGQLKALEGMPVKLECEIRSDSKVEVRWYRETMEINPCNNSRFAIHYNGSKYSLTIANIREDDSGRYVCEANNRMGKVSSFARILVVIDPRIIEADAKLKTSLSVEPEDRPPQFTMRIRDRRVQTTYPVRLTCQVIGHPIPEVTWYKNETEISQDERHVFWDDDSNFHTLEIIHSTLEDSGCYMVTARNINGSVSCRCNLVVDKGIRAYIAPEFLRDLNAVYTIPSGGELRMSAQLEAYPSVGVVWHRDGIRLRPSRRAVMTLSHDGTIQFSLANITARDAGIYSCTATNVVGQTETSTRVAVITTDQNNSSIDESSNVTSTDIPYSKEPLFVTKPLSTEAIEGDTVIILCEVVGDPKPEVIWLRDFLKPDYYKDAPHFRLVGAGPQYRLEIPYAKLDFTGTYSVIARNCHGEAKAVISLQIYAKGQGKEEQTQKFPHGKILTLPIIKRELQDLRCCDGDAVSLECKVYATPEPPLVRWERGGKIIAMMGDFAAEFNGETARLSIQHVYPEDEGEYTCVAYNDLGKAYTSACLVVDVPEGKENTLSQRLTRPMGLLSAGSTPRSTPRSTPIRSLSPAVSHGREFRSPQVLSRSDMSKRPKVCPPKFYAVPHNRLVQEGETVRFQCAVIGHPAPWVRWDKNGTVVTPSARISIKERDDIKILEIIDVMREDAALYRVIAENDFGRIEASARLEVINRYETTSRTIRTRSASPRTHPIFDRSLLPTTSRINSRLQLECRVRGTPSVTPTWYRNGRPLERSSRIKRYFDGTTARMEISKIKGSDAGEYTCIATNILGSTRSTCEVTVLDPYDPSFADKTTPQFLRSLPEESIVMENHCHEFQTGVIGTPPFTITWYKDGRELPDNDYYKYIVYEDGGVALRLSKVRPQDAGEYTCIVRNDFGIASCSNLFAVQDYKNVSKLALQFTKTPLSVTAAKGTIACFCARVQCEKTVDIIWTINGKDARESTKCKIERNSNVSILRIRDVSLRDTGVIRCTASINRKGPAISCIAKLQLQNSFYNLSNAMTKPEDIQIHAHTKLSLINTNLDMLEKITELSSLKCWRRREKSLTHIESSSFSRRAASYTKHVSPLPRRKQISNNVSNDTQTFRIEDDLSVQRIITKNLDTNLEFSKSQISLSSLNEEDINDTFIKLSSVKKTEELYHQAIDPISNNEYMESYLRGLTKATIIKEPTDISVIKGSAAVLRAIYQGYPEPTIKWFQVNRELRSGEKIGIVNRDGVSRLTLDDVTYDHAGKYEISVENSLGKDRRFFSLAVEGPPEPLADKPSVKLSDGQTTIVWRSPPYDGGRTLIGYTVEARRASESTWTVIAESCHSLSHTVATTEKNSVIPGESYYFRIRAENIHGLSDPSMESELVRILREGETMLQEEDEDKSEPSFEPRIVIPEEGKFFGEKYDVLEELGKGRYGVVKKVIERLTGVNFAAKFVRTIKTKDREQVREEIKIMNALRHPKLLLLVAAYEYPRETVLITEYISGGELFERVVADDFILTERDSILFMRQICQGVEYMHQNKIVHLDLKPENIMCCTRTSHQIKLIDFGLAQTLKSDTPIRVLFGTPEFIPPEIINYEPIGIESDMWSVGVICYVLLTGLSPFMGDNDAETFANITRADYDLEDKAFDAISNDAKNFISGLLIKRKDLRMSATQCLEHPWMVQHTAAMSRVVLPTEKLKKFIIRRKWQKTGNAIRALGRMAILSAYSRRSPTTTAESSPTLEQSLDNIEIQYSDGIESISNTTAVDIETENIEMSTKENFTKIESQTNLHSTRVEVTEANVTIQKTSTKEKNNLNTLSKQINIEKEIPEMESGIESMPKIEDIPQNVTSHLEILVSNENKKSNEEIIDKFSKIEQYTIPKPQTFHRIFRGNSHDSGIDDCNSNLVTSPLQIDELGIVSTIKKEIDHETRTREGKQTLKKDENQQNLTAGILINLVQGKKTHLCDTEIIADNDKVAMTKSDMTKALCETNYIQKVADENADTRILSGHNRDKFLPTGNVSRTARIFETESATSNSSNSQVSVVQRAAIITGKPYNERIQKVFAFWNK